jgi:hypothetical protein
MSKFLTASSEAKQLPKKGMFVLSHNELYKDEDGTIYIAWRGFRTDQFTWLRKANWDTRAAHIHDVGCKYHQVVEVLLTEHQLCQKGYLQYIDGEVICKDIPAHYLRVKDVSGHWINNLFYRMLRDADCPKTPKYIQCLYRAGVACNVGWFKSGKIKIDLDKIYNEEWNKL